MSADSLRALIEQIVDERVARILAERDKPAAAMVDVATYAAARSIGQSTVRKAIKAGRLRCVRIGRSVRVPADAEIAKSRQVDTPAERADRVLARLAGAR